MAFKIDRSKCNRCGSCIEVCPKRAITMHSGSAIINEDLCNQCGACADVCPADAIREVALANVKLPKGSETMQYGYGRGFGFRGTSPSWPYIGRGRGGLPRCWHPGLWGIATYTPPAPYWPPSAAEGELGFLKNQAEAMKSQLEDIERRIQEMEKKD